MVIMTAMPRTGEDWTVDDLDRLPGDGLQYELLDGLLLVTPAPVPVHQRAIDPEVPSLIALELVDGVYATAAHAEGDETASLSSPFVIDVVPADLVRPPAG